MFVYKMSFRSAIKVKVTAKVSAKVKSQGLSYLFYSNLTDLSQLVRLNFGLRMYLGRNFGLSLSLNKSLSPKLRSQQVRNR